MTTIIRPAKLAKDLGISVVTLWRWVKTKPDFPQPLRLSDGVSGFTDDDRDAFIKSVANASRANPKQRATAATAAAASVKSRADRRDGKGAQNGPI